MPPITTHRRREPIRRFGRSEDGTAAVELAMCVPLLLVLLFFGIEIGRLLVDFQAVSKSLRDTTRYLSQVGITCPGTAPSNGDLEDYIDNPADETIARNLALTGTPDAGNLLLPYWTGAGAGAGGSLTMTVNCVAIATYGGIYEGAALIPQITVLAAVPFDFIWGTTFAATTGVNINISHSQVYIGG